MIRRYIRTKKGVVFAPRRHINRHICAKFELVFDKSKKNLMLLRVKHKRLELKHDVPDVCINNLVKSLTKFEIFMCLMRASTNHLLDTFAPHRLYPRSKKYGMQTYPG